MWFDPSGREMSDDAWNADFVHTLMVRLAGDAIAEVDKKGNRIRDDTFLLLLSAANTTIPFTLPPSPGQRWERILDTGDEQWGRSVVARGKAYRLRPRSLAVLQLRGTARGAYRVRPSTRA